MKKITLIVPCYNEESNVEEFYNAAKKIFELSVLSKNIDFNILFINDGSKDKTIENINKLHSNDSRVKCISFSRNFGKEAALFAGIRYSISNIINSDAAIILDADLQHPVSIIPEMISKWLEGYQVIEGVKKDRGKESFIHKIFTNVFYSLISKAVGMDMKNSSDYKLLDKTILIKLAELKERNTFFRALSFWCGFKKTTVFYEVKDRNAGESKWSTKSLIKYAINNVVCFSYAPLHFVTGIGVIFLLIALIVTIDSLISFFNGTAADGIPTLVILSLIGFGSVMISLGIIGVYIAQIYDEVKGRPQYIIGETIE